MLRIGFTDCPYCHRADIHISRAKSLGEELVILLLLRPVRCRDCMRRFFLPLFGRALPAPVKNMSSRGPSTEQTSELKRRKEENRVA
jgi:hypothetical protein